MSIRARLFFVLLAATGVIWISAFWWIQHSTRAEVERVLDARLAEAARMAASLVAHGANQAGVVGADASVREPSSAEARSYARQIACQIWRVDGTPMARSRGAPSERLAATDSEGFSDSVVDGERWRVYTVFDAAADARVMVGDRVTVRQRLVRDVTTGLVVPGLLVLPALAGLIWLALSQGLAPLESFARTLATRGPADLTPMSEAPRPREISPVVRAINGLMARVGTARAMERDFITYAAHELKTPLAGLKAQAQVAARAPDAATRDKALAHIESAVIRTDRLVSQLLDLARAEAADTPAWIAPVPAIRLMEDVVSDLEHLARCHGVEIRLSANNSSFVVNDQVFLQMILRNLVENAIQASPIGAIVQISLTLDDKGLAVRIADRGPGFSESTAATGARFRRGHGSRGSGLGLAIVRTAAERMGASVVIKARNDGTGTLARVDYPLERRLTEIIPEDIEANARRHRRM